jgi:hypothetical protein
MNVASDKPSVASGTLAGRNSPKDAGVAVVLAISDRIQTSL